ncbi:hypothetical protein B7494_g8594 [Chlorociboria aeruginascens]|nr:hypothetical protein B7494_g8594 [Chlorociboria aeruginascens]
MGSRDQQPREAYVEDVDEQSGNAMRSTRRSASTKEKPKVSQRERERAQKSQSDSGYSTGIVAGSEASSPDTPFRETQVEVVTERERERERGDRRKSSSSGRNARRSSSRPPSAHGTRLPKGVARADDPTHYGKNPAAPSAPVVSQPIPLRPRTLSSPHRPNSYHQAYAGNNYPPLSASAHYTPHPFAAPPFASPSPQYTHYASPSLLRQPHPQPQPDYFQQPRTIEYMQPRSLESRFVEPARSASAFGTRPPPARSQAFDPYIADYHDDGYLSATGAGGGGAGATIQRGGECAG